MNHELQNFGDMNATIPIYSLSGAVVATAIVTEPAVSHEELMTADYVQLSWNSDTGDTLPAGAYITLGGERYSLLEPYTPARANEAEYQYTPQFQSRIMAWQKHIVPLYTYDTDGTTVKTREMDWNFTGSPADAMYMVQQAIKNETGEQWTVQLADSLPATITVSSQSGSIFSLLSDIAGQCETEWWADKATNTLYLSRCQRGTAIALTVGDNVGVPSVTASQDGYYTRFYVFGSTRNVTQDSGASVANSVVNKRLTLDPATYPGGYIDVRPNLQEGEIFTKTLYYDDIYPSSKLTISDVRARLKYRLDSNGNKIEAGTDDSGHPIYEQYAIWYFKIAGFDFDPTTIIPQTNLSVHFEDGQLAGRDFELTYHDKADNTHYTDDAMPFVVEAGDYEITIDESGGTIIPGLAYIIPQDGDKVILYNIVMPAEYTASAQQELAERAQKDIAKMTADNNSYEMDSYPTEFEADDTDLTLGQAVTYTNGDTVLSTRVLMVEKHLDANCQQRIRVGNALIKGNTQQLREEMTQATQNIDILAAFNNLSASVSNAYAKVQREMLEGFARIGDMWKFDPDDPTVIYSKYSAYVNGFLSAKGKNPESGSTPGGATTLAALTDVFITTTPKDGQVLAYDITIKKWKPVDMEATAGIDEAQLAQYLTTNNYAKKSDITAALTDYALKTTRITAGTGLTGGGTLAQDVTLSLAAVGTAGTYTKVTVDAYGRVTGHASLTQGDIPALAISKITGLQTALDAKLNKSVFEELFEKVWVSGYGYAIRAKLAFFSDDWISAKGLNSDAGSTTGGVDENEVLQIVEDAGYIKSSALNGYATQSWVRGLGYATQSWVNQQGFLKSVAWADVTGTPTTLAGYGITDAITYETAEARYIRKNLGTIGNGTDLNDYGASGLYFVSASDYTSIANFPEKSQYGYGILANLMNADKVGIQWYVPDNNHNIAVRMSWNGTRWNDWNYFLTNKNYTGYTVTRTGGGASGTWGIGISGNAASATKLQTAREIWGKSFDGTANVSGDLRNVGSIIPLSGYYDLGTSSNYWNYIWAYRLSLIDNGTNYICSGNGDNATYNTYNIKVHSNWGIGITDNEDICRLVIDARTGSITMRGALSVGSYVQIGSARLYYDSGNNALYVQKSDGSACGFYATGFVSAKGANDDGGDTEATVLTIADERNTTIYPDTYAGRGIRGLFRANATDGLNDGGTYHTVMHIRQWANSSGGLSHQLAFTDNGGVWHRTATSETAWGEWSELSALSGLGDVAISSPVNGQALIYRNGVWKNETVSGGGSSSVAWADVTGKPTWIPDTDGSGSGIDADLLDGTHKSGLFTAMTYAGSTLSLTIGGVRKSVNIETSAVIPTVTVSSSSSRNLSVNVGGSTDYVNDLYATYLGGTTKAGLFTGLTYSSNKLSVTIGGTTRSVTINAGSSGSYLPLSGGTVTGNLVVDTGSGTKLRFDSDIRVSMRTNAGWARAFSVYNSTFTSIIMTIAGAYGGVNSLTYLYYGGTYESPGMAILPNKNVGIGTTSPTYKLHVSGTAYASGGFQNGSDIRYKHVLSALPLTVAQVAAAPSFLFRWTDGTADGVQAGTSAQYWQQVMPQVVTESAGRLSMQYDKAALAAAIATARAVETLDQRVTRLEKENARLRRRLRQHKINV